MANWEKVSMVDSRLDCEKHPFSYPKLKKTQLVKEALLMGSDWDGRTAAVRRQPSVVLCGRC